MEKLSFVIPCYGSETTIEIVVNEIRETLKQRPEYDYEIILVNDCSPDRSGRASAPLPLRIPISPALIWPKTSASTQP